MKTREEMKKWEKKAELIKVLGVNQKAGVKVGDEIEHPLHGIKTKVVAVYKDLLGNERILTEHAKQHVEEKIKRLKKKKDILREKGIRNISAILADPDLVIEDTKESAIIYMKKVDNDTIGVVVGKENKHYIYTVQPMSRKPKGERYIKLYER